MGPEYPSKPLLFRDRGQQSESLSRSTSDETSTINSPAQRWRTEQLRRQKSLSGLEKSLTHGNAPLLFVNKGKDPRPLSRSKDTEAASINSHAQRWRNQKIRQQKNEALRSDAAGAIKIAISGWKSWEMEKKTLASSDGPVSAEEKDQDLTDAPFSKTDFTVVEPFHWHTRHRKPHQIIERNFVKGKCIDPFSMTAVPISKEIQSLLTYFLALAIPATYKGETLPTDQPPESLSLSHRHSPAVRAIVSGALFNTMHLFALLTATAGCMKHISKINLSKSNLPEVFMQKAITDIRAYLQSCADKIVDKQVVIDIFYLCVFEWYLQNYDAALTHLTAVSHIMNSLDANSKLDQYMQETICYNDVFISIETSTPPVIPLTWDAQPLTTTRWAKIRTELSTNQEYRRMGTGFIGVLSQHIFGAAMEVILAEFIVWIDVAQYTWICKTATKAEAEWIFRKGKAILHRLVSIPAISPKDLALSPSQRKEECCRLVLIILLSYISTETYWRSGKMNMTRLQKALRNIDDNWGSDFLNHMLLWVLVWGAFAAEGAAEEDWFVLRVLKVARVIDVSDYDALNEVMSEFFCSKKLQHASMHKLAAQMLDEKALKATTQQDHLLLKRVRDAVSIPADPGEIFPGRN